MVQVSESDRRVQLWNKVCAGTIKSFRHLHTADDHVILVIDMADEGGEVFLRALYQIGDITATGRAMDTMEDEISRLRREDVPALAVLPLDATIRLFLPIQNRVSEALKKTPDPGSVRVVVISDGAIVLHEPIPVGTN